MAQANLTQTPFLQVGKLGPKRHRGLCKVMSQLQGFSPPFPKSLCQPPLRGPPPARARALEQRAGLPRPHLLLSHGLSGWKLPDAQTVSLPSWLQSAESNCQTSGTSVSLKAWLPFHPFRRQQAKQGPQPLCQLLGSFVSPWGTSPDSPGQSSPLGMCGRKA